MQKSKKYSSRDRSKEIEMFFMLLNKRLYKKAVRYLEEKKFDDIVFDGDSISAIVHGEHGDYVAYIGRDGMSCGCPAFRGRKYLCYHLIALAIFSVRKRYFSPKRVLKYMGLDKVVYTKYVWG